MAILWPFLPFCISFFPCALGWQQNSQEQCDEDTLDWKKKKKKSCLLHVIPFYQGKGEPVNSYGAAWLEGHSTHRCENLVSSVV